MLTRTRTARHAVRTAHRSSRPPEPTCPLCAATTSRSTGTELRDKQVVRPRAPPIDWSQPSTSKWAYTPSRPFSSAAPRLGPAASASPAFSPAPTPPLPRLHAALRADTAVSRVNSLRAVADELEAAAASSAFTPQTLSRSTFEALFDQVAALLADEPAFAIPILKRLRDLALHQPGWSLSLEQRRAVLAARVAQEEKETNVRRQRWSTPAGSRAKGGGKMRARWHYLDECADEYWVGLQLSNVVLAEAERAEAGTLLERYARAVAARLSPSQPPEIAVPLAARSALFHAHAFSLLPPFPLSDAPTPDHLASKPLVPLFQHDRPTALSHLRALLAQGRLPSSTVMCEIVTAHYAERDAALVASTSRLPSSSGADADEEAAYAHARTVLDAACAGRNARSQDALDALLQQRLERVERAEALARAPALFFLRWLGVALPAEEGARTEERREMLECAMRLWEASQVQGRSEWEVPARRYARSTVARLLETLVLEAVRVEGEAYPSEKVPASSCLVEAVQLAMRYLQHHILVHHATPLLRAVTVSSHAPALAHELFDLLATPSTPGSTSPPFAWSVNLLPAFTTLFFSATSARDTSLPIRLYLSWTSSGLSFPVGLWPALWRAAGRRGSVDELRRLVNDWEDTGRGPVAARIMRFVLCAAAETRVVAPLRMLAFFRARYVSRPGASPSPLLLHAQPFLVVPLAAYEAVLSALATSHTDRRRAMRAVWRWMTQDGHTPSTSAYNALVQASVSRPPGQFSLADLDAAGVAYNALVAQARTGGPQPDGRTFALLVRGFARVAAGGARSAYTARKRRIALEAARRTFDAASTRALHVPGVEAALLVRLLARAGRFEDAKTVQERWWSGVVALEVGGKGVWEDKALEKEMREMRRARSEAERVEARWVASGREVEDGGGGSEEAIDLEEPMGEAELAPGMRPLDSRR